MTKIEIDKTDEEKVEHNEVVDPQVVQETEIPETSHSQNVAKTPLRISPTLVLVVGGLIVLLLAVGIVTLVRDRSNLRNEVHELSQNQKADPNAEAKQLDTQVRQLIELPTGDLPTVATVVDAGKVKNQPFFADALNGDKVLLYAKSGKAVLYRPSVNKIIEVAPINLGAASPTSSTKQ